MRRENGRAGPHQLILWSCKKTKKGNNECANWRGGNQRKANLLERVHTKTFVHAGRVAKEAGDGRLEEEAKSQDVVPHALLEEWVASSFANEQIGPLHDDDRNEEGRVAGVFQLLTGVVGLIGSSSSINRLSFSIELFVNLPILVRKSRWDRWWPSNPTSYECQEAYRARIRFQPKWPSRRRSRQTRSIIPIWP